jgi:serine protease Do
MEEKPVKQPGISHTLRDRTAKMILAVLVVISISFVGGYLGARVYLQNPSTEQQTENARQLVDQESQLISTIASDVGPSVVSVNVTGASSRVNPYTGQAIEQQSAGTGFIVSDKGYILTNRHVVPAAVSKVSVTLADGTVLDNVSVVGRTNDDDSLDVAFLKINDAKGKTLKPVSLGDSDAMKVGGMVVAIGNALGEFQNTVTSGIISGYGRSVAASGGGEGTENLQNLFQTDAAINQGNSGGPLVNADGEVIGINTAVATGEAENIGFAIPINDALGLIEGIISKGQVLRPYIGVRYVQLDADRAKELGIPQTEGAYISEDSADGPGILPNSPAAAGGLRAKDVITEVNGTKVSTKKPLTAIISRYPVDEKVKVTFLRDGKSQTVELTLQASPAK